ncbi:hypothetical protein FKW77_000011 [Venturia effusa]|uniref:Ubiquitin-like domain-containing protein n=1 Tax=Venturia effusa TaxID=50376 RepID=A0A517LPD8_9PEZI|nr:hypothetical protein FKW77_000011 [Venturia effusa]
MDRSPPEERTTIDVKILSPSQEVGIGGLQLKNIAVTTTIGALKAAIANSIPSHPQPERQRLIYLGRALSRDDDELSAVFGREAIQNDNNHTLHLVLREASSLQTRPASVPPHSSNPFRNATANPPASTVPTPIQRNPFASPQPSTNGEQTPPLQQPGTQPNESHGVNPLTHILANANIRATSNGMPINLPPEVINQLLNQRLAQDGSFNFLQNMQPRAQLSNQPLPQPAPGPSSNPSLEGPSLLQQHWAQQQAALAANFAAAAPMARQDSEPPGNRGRERSTHRIPTSQPTSPGTAPRRASNPDRPTTGAATPAVPDPGTSGSSAPSGPHQPHSHTIVRAGVNPDGTRWQTTTVQFEGPNHHHNHPHNHAPGQLPPGHLPFPIPPQVGQMPIQLPGQIPLMQPLPRLPTQYPLQAMNPAMHLRMGTPPTGGLGPRPGVTPRSVSPARSVSGEGPRRVATPAAELQHRLNETMREVRNVNTLLGVMTTGNLAHGGTAPPLGDVEREQLRVTAHNMNQHIEGFGAHLTSLTDGHPNMRSDPDFAILHSQYQVLQAQGKAIRHQVGALTGTGNGPTLPGGNGSADLQLAACSENFSHQNSTTLNIAPTTGDSQRSPIILPSAAAPQIHVLSDASGIPQALLINASGQYTTPALSPAVMNALMAAQLPYDQLVQQFTRGVQQLISNSSSTGTLTDNAQLVQALNTFAAARQTGQAAADDDAVIQRMNHILGQERGRRDIRRTRRRNPDAQVAGDNPPAIVVEDAAALGQAQPLAIAPNQLQLQQQVARGANNEVRDMLAPIVRNLWLAARLAAFAYFFLSSGRGYWRVLLLGGIGLAIYALNSGWLGRNVDNAWEGLRRHFETLVNDARRGVPVAPTAAQVAYNNAHPTPEDTARRLLEEHHRRNRSATQEFIDRAVARVRQAERTFALFVASLWPGVGEGVIRAQEQARREEQQRIEEDRRKKEEEDAKKKEEEARVKDLAGEGSSGSTALESTTLPQQRSIKQGEGSASEPNVKK